MSHKPTVMYFSIKEASHKLSHLIHTAQKHLHEKKSLHILTSDKTSLSFVSQLLWKEPKQSFTVHQVPEDANATSIIQLILPIPSYEKVESIFNLTSLPIDFSNHFRIIYEFEDLTHPAKKEIFEKKFKLYRDAGFTLCSN
jgi:DNA polymerase IIIc chi subunit